MHYRAANGHLLGIKMLFDEGVSLGQLEEEKKWEAWLNTQAAFSVEAVLDAHFPDIGDLPDKDLREQVNINLNKRLAEGFKAGMRGGLRTYLNKALDDSLTNYTDRDRKEFLKQKLRKAIKQPLREYLDNRLVERLEEYRRQLQLERQEYYGTAVDESIDRRNALEVEQLRLNPLVFRQYEKTLAEWLEDRQELESSKNKLQAVEVEINRLQRAQAELQTRIDNLTQQLAAFDAAGTPSSSENTRPPAVKELSDIAGELNKEGLSNERKRELQSKQQKLLQELTEYRRKRPRTREEIAGDLRDLQGDDAHQVVGELPDVENRLGLRKREAISLLAEMRALDRQQLRTWLREGMPENQAMRQLENERGNELTMRAQFMTRVESLELRKNAADALREETHELARTQGKALNALYTKMGELRSLEEGSQSEEQIYSQLFQWIKQQRARWSVLSATALSSEERSPFNQERLLRMVMWQREEADVLEENVLELQQQKEQKKLSGQPEEIQKLLNWKSQAEKIVKEVDELATLVSDREKRSMNFLVSLKDECDEVDWIVENHTRWQEIGLDADLSAARNHLNGLPAESEIKEKLLATTTQVMTSNRHRRQELQRRLEVEESAALALLQRLEKKGEWTAGVHRARERLYKTIDMSLGVLREMLDKLEDAHDAGKALPNAQLQRHENTLLHLRRYDFEVMTWERQVEHGVVVRKLEKLQDVQEKAIERLNAIATFSESQQREKDKLLTSVVLRQDDIQFELNSLNRVPINYWEQLQPLLAMANHGMSLWQREDSQLEVAVKGLEIASRQQKLLMSLNEQRDSLLVQNKQLSRLSIIELGDLAQALTKQVENELIVVERYITQAKSVPDETQLQQIEEYLGPEKISERNSSRDRALSFVKEYGRKERLNDELNELIDRVKGQVSRIGKLPEHKVPKSVLPEVETHKTQLESLSVSLNKVEVPTTAIDSAEPQLLQQAATALSDIEAQLNEYLASANKRDRRLESTSRNDLQEKFWEARQQEIKRRDEAPIKEKIKAEKTEDLEALWDWKENYTPDPANIDLSPIKTSESSIVTPTQKKGMFREFRQTFSVSMRFRPGSNKEKKVSGSSAVSNTVYKPVSTSGHTPTQSNPVTDVATTFSRDSLSEADHAAIAAELSKLNLGSSTNYEVRAPQIGDRVIEPFHVIESQKIILFRVRPTAQFSGRSEEIPTPPIIVGINEAHLRAVFRSFNETASRVQAGDRNIAFTVQKMQEIKNRRSSESARGSKGR